MDNLDFLNNLEMTFWGDFFRQDDENEKRLKPEEIPSISHYSGRITSVFPHRKMEGLDFSVTLFEFLVETPESIYRPIALYSPEREENLVDWRSLWMSGAMQWNVTISTETVNLLSESKSDESYMAHRLFHIIGR